ncbi:Ger(x)C family spore germination protein [Paenibacillus sp. BC26]|uniref:Ger(x)C family spore germination protein n=1 Tax=Paenibacillus sp. BC26 TaxID=1881032 RepID=UPI0008E18417|nr:Ger(x)C family spore germination protein [Paenibacillus sp. BC26]SFS46190.1 germination protein, Ger(x)C family [Paenibacillus sp. BC26]
MKPRSERTCLLLLLLPLLTGCWDSRELKEIRIEQAEAFDLLDNGNIRFTITIPTIKSAVQSKSSIVSPSFTGDGRTVNEAYLEMKKAVSQELDFGKARVILINKRFAKKGFYPALESYYREARSPINVKMAVVNDSAGLVLKMKVADRLMISDYLYDLLQSSEENGLIPKVSPYLISSLFTNSGTDAVLPIINPLGKDRVKLEGLALMHGKRMTGELDDKTSANFVMLSKFNPKYFTVTEYINTLKANVSLFMSRDKRDITVATDKGTVKAVISADFTCNLVEIPKMVHPDEEMLKKVASELEKLLNDKAKEVITQLQQANCDALGIGLHIKAHHNRYWKSITWEDVYPEIDIEPRIKVSIDKSGIME